MKYVVVESKIYENDVNTITTFTYNDRNTAEQKFYTTVAAAVVSERPVHAVVLMTAEGQFIDRKVYYHSPVVEPEEETEPTDDETEEPTEGA